MPVISGVIQAVKIAQRIGIKYRYLDPTNKFIRKFVPPGYRKRAFQAKQIIDVLIVGGVISNAIGDYYRGLRKRTFTPSSQIRKRRNYMEQPGSKQFNNYRNRYSNRRRQPNYCKPSRNWRYR